jgi:tryptophanase
MISLEQAKKILLDNGERYSDQEVQEIYKYLYSYAEITLIDSKKDGDSNK